jgi:ferritin-like metal-binding protein YciE
MDSLAELLEEELKDLYNAENQLIKALPKMAKKASSSALKTALTMHLKETENHVKRLDTIGQELGMKLTGKKCKAMEGLVEEGKEVLEEDGMGPVIAAYGTTRAMAEILGHSKVAKLLQQTLDEEGAADKKLTDISEGEVLTAANNAGESDGEEDDDE